MSGSKPKCQHCELGGNIQCSDCKQWACIFCAMHGVHEVEAHAESPRAAQIREHLGEKTAVASGNTGNG